MTPKDHPAPIHFNKCGSNFLFVLFTTNDWCSDAQIKEFFHCGIEDIESIVELCDTYDAKCPHEFKLVYNVNSKSFDSNYNYENVTDVYDKDVIELVEEWFNECKKNISH